MIRKTGIIFGFLVSVFIVTGLLLPSTFSVSRSIEIRADQATIHHYVGELENWDLWTPWKELDPSVVVTLGERTSGIGASQSWTGKDGDGSLTVIMSSPDKGIKYDLLFDDSDSCESTVSYSPASSMMKNKTRVTWAIQGEMTTPVIGGYIAIIMDTFTGDMFDRGLNKLKLVAEESMGNVRS